MKEHIRYIFDKILSRKERWFIYLIILGIALGTVLQINGSSIGMWDHYLSTEDSESHIVIGIPRSIRSDEWMVQTPLTLSQVKQSYPEINESIGDGENTVIIYDAPNRHWSTFFKPHNIGFFILPESNAFAFKWWFRSGIMMIAVYLLLMLFTKNNILISISGALLLFFTPMIQWWYAIQVLEPIAYGFLSLYMILKICMDTSTKKWAYMLGLIYSSVAFTISFYPAFQVPVAYILLAMGIGYIVENWDTIKQNLTSISITLGSSLLISIAIIASYFYSVRDIIHIILNTSYPGARFENGGHQSLLHFLNGPYSFFLQFNSKRVPLSFGNQSEAANFITIVICIVIIPIVIYIVKSKKKKEEMIMISLLALFIVQCIFMFIGFYPFFSKISLFYVIPENRMMIGIGLISFIVLLLFADKLHKKIYQPPKYLSKILAIITFVFVFLIGRELFIVKPEFVRNFYAIALISCTYAVLIYLLLEKKIKSFLLLLLIFSMASTVLINPINHGLQPLRQSSIANEIIHFNENQNQEKKKWIAFDSLMLGNFLIAQGIPTLNGTHLYPQLEIWKVFDKDGQYKSNYNRYSHIVFRSTQESTISFSNPVPDTLEITINPCNEILVSFEIVYFLAEENLQNYHCLVEAKTLKNNFKIYQYKTKKD